MDTNKTVAVIGGGIAGMEAATFLSARGITVYLIEKEDKLGGHLLDWERLFPTMRNGSEVVKFLMDGVKADNIKIMLSSKLTAAEKSGKGYNLRINENVDLFADAVLVTTGYDLFDATKKEEYGYGIYDNVITSADLEKIFMSGKALQTKQGNVPKKIGLVHCVGSRDEKAGNVYCSKVCCVTGVKQAIEIKQKMPYTEVFNFYMDLRMYGMHFEALYKKAQADFGIQFIRGRLSEASEDQNGGIILKVEDTLMGKPLKLTVDILVLLIGLIPAKGSKEVGELFGLKNGVNGFYKTTDQHTLTNSSNVDGVFFAGACTSPKTITNTITDARAAASTVAAYLFNYRSLERKIEQNEDFWLYNTK
ncbi:MAG: hypothetical protein A2W91_06250 [Bacteroidetes bacterium GWF2_38_335]|nr:MAG: hypothetical protein A2W91_06250 [Bacteroidetes bacterium GWF2_38_335]OFY79651.1 MAG: hypothetical protein A2281_09430 [Bacteroidetes bacterium RIFOXYA12_FULL_38_20]HBS89027.1 FAD-dependent oxidoreductase [Bacteroidales bacterium]